MERSDRSGRGGFTLIEVLVALTILAVGLLALALLQTTAIKGNAVASKSTIATQLGQDQLETFRHVAWGTVVSSPAGGYDTGTMTPVYTAFPGSEGSVFNVGGANFYLAWLVTNTTPTLRTVTVWVCWQDDRQGWHNVMLSTQRVNIGI